ncbi:3-keto-disaccharide hydrolase [Cesiribacter andamanensis]|uniref:3-keto-alpha-glucoside-1,2-lyase/3-keto-2-hydroxy-glucal hydratase domain-containing protein n=1 Tax=Cesiribacter andamanensis AMV16 TaxID=1279009 RepID=M7N130_9BACT|nr:DUF1080 domain-containing protein [Cesiribacter andamanensis]EMR02378.1 hypothetical protein ADICEAN_02474 [Cesiribacter andamanensis AMV16]
MKVLISLAGFALAVAACNSSTPTETTQDQTSMQDTTQNQQEWISLFDGETTRGWHRYGGEAVGSAWKVQDGMLYLDASNKADWQASDGGDIVTEQEFEDFHLQLEWRISENGNSGIMFYVQEDTTQFQYPWQTGPEMQILHNEGHPDGKIITHRAGDLYDLITAKPETVKGPGEWNLAEIISQDGQLTFRLNGADVVQTTLWDDAWRKMIAGSKFKDMKGFGTYKSGKIALQDHGDNVWFRNIRIKRL